MPEIESCWDGIGVVRRCPNVRRLKYQVGAIAHSLQWMGVSNFLNSAASRAILAMVSPKRVRRRCTAQAARLAGTCVAYFSLVAVAQSAWQIPLTELEQGEAVSIALAVQEPDPESLRQEELALSRDALGSVAKHPLGVQVLLAELQENKNSHANDHRRVEVFLFDYDLGVTLLKLVDVERVAMVSTTVVDTVHLPLSDAEIQFARSVIHGHARLQTVVAAELSNSIKHHTGKSGIEDLHSRISVWVPDADTDMGSNCSNQRCALVSLFTRDDYSLSVEPVVNLFSGEIYLDLFQ